MKAELLEAQTANNLLDDIETLTQQLTEQVHGKVKEQMDAIATEGANLLAKKLVERMRRDTE